MKKKTIYLHPFLEHFWETQYKNNLDFFTLIKDIFLQTLVEIIFWTPWDPHTNNVK